MKQHLGVNFGDIYRFEHRFCFLGVFMLKKSGLIFKSPMATASRMRDLIMAGQ